MIDHLLGSHYVGSAIALAVAAGNAIKPGGIPDNKEAIRLYEAAVADMKLGIEDTEKHREQLKGGMKVDAVLDDCRFRADIWAEKAAKLRNGTYRYSP